MPNACNDDVGGVTHQLAAFLLAGVKLVTDCNCETAIDACLSILFHACGGDSASIFLNKSSGASRGKGITLSRPDTRVVIHGFDVERGESKEKPSGVDAARHDLTKKLRPWSAAYYGDLPGILGIAAGGHTFKAHFIARDGASRELAKGSFGNPADAVGLARLAMAAAVYARVRIEDEKWGQKKDGVSFRVRGDNPRVEKIYGSARPALAEFYAATREVPGLERGEKHDIDGEARVFDLTPYGCSRKPHPTEARAAMLQIAETVAALHDKGWAHRDLRWPNVVLDCTKQGRRWTVIDCEFAAKVDTAWLESHPPEHGWNAGLVDPIRANDEKVTVHRDYWMLGEMIAELGILDGSGDKDLADIGNQLRAAVGDTYLDNDAANDARKQAFMRLCKPSSVSNVELSPN
jgi:hypothetical protein